MVTSDSFISPFFIVSIIEIGLEGAPYRPPWSRLFSPNSCMRICFCPCLSGAFLGPAFRLQRQTYLLRRVIDPVAIMALLKCLARSGDWFCRVSSPICGSGYLGDGIDPSLRRRWLSTWADFSIFSLWYSQPPRGSWIGPAVDRMEKLLVMIPGFRWSFC